MSNLTLRQIVNNHPWAKKVNGSKLGVMFQNSKFAKGVESTAYLFKEGVSREIISGSGIIESLKDGIKNAFSGEGRCHCIHYSLGASRPDLCGAINPSKYDYALMRQAWGNDPDTLIKELRR
ncbi:hypothetical protein JW756_05590 [Candidatus Woesearchaeota archaeon]|nr:hypothetical protein [Candidatus Woesearchaeota archaeon]